MIKSPLRPAMTQPLTSPYDLITRYFRANNGVGDYAIHYQSLDTTSSAEFRVKVQFSCLYVANTTPRIWSVFTDDSAEYLRLQLQVVNGEWVAKIETLGRTPGNGSINIGDGKLHTVEAVINTNTGFIQVYVDGALDYTVTHTLPDQLKRDFNVSTMVAVTSTPIAPFSYFGGIVSLFRAEVDGIAKQLIKFDNPNSVYQTNHAVAQGVELGFIASVLNSGWSFDGTAYNYSGDVFTFLGDTGRFEIGKSYLVDFTAVVNAGQLLVRQSTSGSNVFDTTVSGNFKVVITVADGSTDNVYFCSAFFDGARFAGSVVVNSIREFHGCVVVGGMPEDWFQVERQPHWDYWLGPELHDKNNYGVYLEATITDDGESVQLLAGSSVRSNSWYGYDDAGLVVGKKYQVVHQHDLTSGLVRMRIGESGDLNSVGETINESGIYSDSLINSAAGSATLVAMQSQSTAPVVKTTIKSIKEKLEIAE